MSLWNHCDRCGAQGKLRVDRDLPPGWERVCGTDLCNDCSRLLHEFLSPLKTVEVE